ncbi:MAG: histidinol dehydrogenase, partial [Lysobacteraceae bacterium]
MNAPLGNRIGLNLLTWDTLDDAGRRAALRRPTQDSAAAVRLGVGKIVARVRADGDAALRKFSRLLDRAALDVFEVTAEEFLAAEASLDPTLKAAIIDASQRIDAFHRDGGMTEYAVDTAPGVQCRR